MRIIEKHDNREIHCPRCDFLNHADARFCSQCGAQITKSEQMDGFFEKSKEKDTVPAKTSPEVNEITDTQSDSVPEELWDGLVEITEEELSSEKTPLHILTIMKSLEFVETDDDKPSPSDGSVQAKTVRDKSEQHE